MEEDMTPVSGTEEEEEEEGKEGREGKIMRQASKRGIDEGKRGETRGKKGKYGRERRKMDGVHE